MADLGDGAAAITGWAQFGGLGLFAGYVLLFLRDTRRELAPLLKDIKDIQVDLRTTLVAMLERDRFKSERAAAQRLGHLAENAPAGSASEIKPQNWDEDEGTPPLGPLPVKHRARTSPHGHPVVGLHGPRRPRQDT